MLAQRIDRDLATPKKHEFWAYLNTVVDKGRVDRLREHDEMLDLKLAESLGQETPSSYRYLQLVVGFLVLTLGTTEENENILRFCTVAGSAGTVSAVGQSRSASVAGSSITPSA